jgi:hypothetical protein
MHRCVCIWRYILQNYNYKLHFQNLSIYHIWHVFIGTLAAENLDVCIACDPWDSNIQLTMVKDRRRQIYPKCHSNRNLRGAPPGAGHAFPRQWHMPRWGGVIYLCQGFFPCIMPSMDGWQDGWMDEWMEKASRKTTTTSFTICNTIVVRFLISKRNQTFGFGSFLRLVLLFWDGTSCLVLRLDFLD